MIFAVVFGREYHHIFGKELNKNIFTTILYHEHIRLAVYGWLVCLYGTCECTISHVVSCAFPTYLFQTNAPNRIKKSCKVLCYNP